LLSRLSLPLNVAMIKYLYSQEAKYGSVLQFKVLTSQNVNRYRFTSVCHIARRLRHECDIVTRDTLRTRDYRDGDRLASESWNEHEVITGSKITAMIVIINSQR